MSIKNALKVIKSNYEDILNNPIDLISVGMSEDPFVWNVKIIGPPDSPYEYGEFDAKITYPYDYPFSPPEFRFITEIYHPNIYKGGKDDGKVCISILHSSGEDPNNYELSEERWKPVHTFTSIILSILSLLNDPNDESPANVDSAILWRNDKKKFQSIINKSIKKLK